MSSHFPAPTTCLVCGRQTDDYGTCRCLYQENKPMPEKAPVAVTLRRMADSYKHLAEQADRGGRLMEASSFWRMHGELLQAAVETEEKLLASYGPQEECQDGSEEFEGDEK
jgi:hypothetical protein